MNIGLQTWGSEGDIRPIIALGYGLAHAGHQVTIGIAQVDGQEQGLDMARKLNLPATPIGSTYFRTNAQINAKRIKDIDAIRNPMRQVAETLRYLYLPIQQEQLQFSQALCAKCDLVIGHFLLDTLTTAAECAKIPYISVMTVGSVPCGAYPPIGVPNLGVIGNLLLWRLAEWVIGRQFGTHINAVRHQLGLPAVRSVLREAWCSSSLNLITNSPTLYQPQPDWPVQHKVCGYLNPPATQVELETELEHFLAIGPPPVYITLGSMLTMPQPLQVIEEVITTMLEAVQLLGIRAIIQAPWQVIDTQATSMPHYGAAGPNVLQISRAPHELVFPRCAAVVHHGGAGTTHAALSAGCPAVIIPHAGDQFYWAKLLNRYGVAPTPLPRQSLTGARLANRLHKIMHDAQYASRAQTLGIRMRAEDGIATAVSLVEHAMSI